MSFLDTLAGLFSSVKVPAEAENITKALGFLRPLSNDVAAFEAAWKAKNVQGEIAAGLPVVEAFLNVAGIIFPQAALAEKGVEILAVVVPLIVPLLANLGSGLQPDGRGGFVPLHGWPLLDKDGNFTGKYS